MNLAVITLNYNSIKNTIRQIDFLLKEGMSNKYFYIVDNYSDDKEQLEKYCEENSIKFILSDKNGGFAYGNNIGINQALKDGKEKILLLNPDIQIIKSCIKSLYDTLCEENNIGIVGPRLCQDFNPNIIVSDGGLLFPNEGFRGDHVNWQKDIKDVNVPILNKDIDYVNGSALMFKKNILDDIGYMREDFFMYYEESEWCYRLKKQTKWELAIKTDLITLQEDSSRGYNYEYYMTRNRIWLCRLHNGNIYIVLKDIFKIIKNNLIGKNKDFQMAKTISKALFHGLIKSL